MPEMLAACEPRCYPVTGSGARGRDAGHLDLKMVPRSSSRSRLRVSIFVGSGPVGSLHGSGSLVGTGLAGPACGSSLVIGPAKRALGVSKRTRCG
jgi:hypothetical protein